MRSFLLDVWFFIFYHFTSQNQQCKPTILTTAYNPFMVTFVVKNSNIITCEGKTMKSKILTNIFEQVETAKKRTHVLSGRGLPFYFLLRMQ
jgi:hypothetical protein